MSRTTASTRPWRWRSSAVGPVLIALLTTYPPATLSQGEADLCSSSVDAVLMGIARLELERHPVSEISGYATSTDPALRSRAARALGRLRNTDAIRLLSVLVDDPMPAVRTETAFALAQIPGSAPALRQALSRESDHDVRIQLLLALGMVGEAEDFNLARVILLETRGAEAAAAAQAMGNMGYRKVPGIERPEVIGALLAALDRLDLNTRRFAAYALGRSGVTLSNAAQADALAAHAGAEADPVARAFLVRAAATGLDDRRWEDLSQARVDDAAEGVRIALLRGLAKRKKPSDEVLLRLLDDPERPVRLTVLETAAGIPVGPDVETRLRALLLDADEEVRALSAVALYENGLLGETRGWFAPDVPVQVRARLAEAWDDRDALLEMAFQDPDSKVRTASFSGLLSQDPPVPTSVLLRLLGHPDPILAGGAAASLAERPDPAAEGPLVQTLARAKEWDLIVGCLVALDATYKSVPIGRKPNPELVAVIEPLRNSPDATVRTNARQIGARLGMPALPQPSGTMVVPSYTETRPLSSAVIRTNRGDVVVAFDSDMAPFTVWWWAHLAGQGFYDGLIFHRVVPDFVVQGGDPRGDGWGGPGTAIPDELNPLPFDAFAVGMALSGPDTGGSQWFIALSPQPHLTGRYTRFGHVVSGQDTVRRLRHGDRILSVSVERLP